MSENLSEINFVKELHPKLKNYASVYDEAGLFGDVPTIMAHCVWLEEDEIELMVKKEVFVAHVLILMAIYQVVLHLFENC